MADKKIDEQVNDESGRDPTARRGDIERGGQVSDADVGQDNIDRKAIGGYGADDGESVRRGNEKPLSDNSRQARGQNEGEN